MHSTQKVTGIVLGKYLAEGLQVLINSCWLNVPYEQYNILFKVAEGYLFMYHA